MVAVGLIAGAAIVTGPSVAGASTRSAKPVISSFTATALDPAYTAISTSPLVLYSSGGLVQITEEVSNALACAFTSNKPLAGMPYNTPCGRSATVLIDFPADAGKRPVTYHIKARALGLSITHAGPVSVVVSSTPNPYKGPGILAGTTWQLVALNSCDDIAGAENFNDDGTFTGGAPIDNESTISGTFSVSAAEDLLQLFVPGSGGTGLVTLAFTWNPSPGVYEGSDNFFPCSYTLSPT